MSVHWQICHQMNKYDKMNIYNIIFQLDMICIEILYYVFDFIAYISFENQYDHNNKINDDKK